jgi:hypothetical protein
VQEIPAGLDGASIVLTAAAGLVCIDLDGIRDPDTGDVEPKYQEIIDAIDSYTEISESGCGLHVFVKGTIPKNSHKNGSKVEIYADKKIIAMTGDALWEHSTLASRDLSELFARVEAGEFAPEKPKSEQPTPAKATTNDPSAEDWKLIGQLQKKLRTNDANALEKAFAAEHPERYEKRNREKGVHDGKNYIAYSVERFLARQPVEVAPKSETVAELVQPCVVDMPDSVLDGRLGEICQKRLGRFPLAYSWGSLITSAGTLIPRFEASRLPLLAASNRCILRTNLYWCPVGPKGTGKSQAIEQALNCLGMWPKHDFLDTYKYGSAEGMLAHLDGVSGINRLLFLNELGHLLEKATIEGSSFSFVLNDAYNSDDLSATLAKSKKVSFNCRLSIAGGLVDDIFGELFGSKSTGGLHDRFIFGLCPKPFTFLYRPYDLTPEKLNPIITEAEQEIWDVRDEWVNNNPGLTPRIAEHALRVAAICAAFDGRNVLRAKDLGPALEFARYQVRVRLVLEPNPGKNPDAQCSFSILGWLQAHAPNGELLPKRALYSGIHADRVGYTIFDRALKNLAFNQEIQLDKIGKQNVVGLSAANYRAALVAAVGKNEREVLP